MTIDEASNTYGIPIDIIKEYESWGLCGEIKKDAGIRQYDQADIKRLSLIMTLYDAGFTKAEAKRYMRLYLSEKNNAQELSEMLKTKRTGLLDEIHMRQEQIDRLDYLRFEKLHKGEKSGSKKTDKAGGKLEIK